MGRDDRMAGMRGPFTPLRRLPLPSEERGGVRGRHKLRKSVSPLTRPASLRYAGRPLPGGEK